MKTSKMLTVTALGAEKTDKNGLIFKTIEVHQPFKSKVIDQDTGELITVKRKARRGAFNAWKHNNLEVANLAKAKGVAMSALKPADLEGIKPDFGWDMEVGEKVEGDIVTRNVKPYDITGADGVTRTVTTYSTAVLGNTEDPSFSVFIEQAFKRAGHEIVQPIERIPNVTLEVASREVPADYFSEEV